MLNCRLGAYGGHSEGLVTECKDYTPTTAPWSQAGAAHFRNNKHTPAGPRRHHSQLSILCRLHSLLVPVDIGFKRSALASWRPWPSGGTWRK